MAALEVMSRFAANPKWLIYLPPTMSPCETSDQDGLAGTPGRGVFATIRSQGVPQVVCEEKHMGSRAVVIVCRDEEAARERFGVVGGEPGSSTPAPAGGSSTIRRLETAVPRPDSGGDGRQRLLGRVQHDLGLPRLRTDALVGQGPGTSPVAVRRRRCRGPGLVAEGGGRAASRPPNGWTARTSGQSS